MPPVSWEIVALASLSINIALLILVYFRSAVNDALVKWMSRRWALKDEKRKLLLELHELMDTFASAYFLMLVMLALSETARTEAERTDSARRSAEQSDTIRKANEFVRKHELEFPQAIRGLLSDLKKNMLLPTAEGFRDRQLILERSDAVTRITKQVRAEIARLTT